MALDYFAMDIAIVKIIFLVEVRERNVVKLYFCPGSFFFLTYLSLMSPSSSPFLCRTTSSQGLHHHARRTSTHASAIHTHHASLAAHATILVLATASTIVHYALSSLLHSYPSLHRHRPRAHTTAIGETISHAALESKLSNFELPSWRDPNIQVC
jgi:hypothetical protein